MYFAQYHAASDATITPTVGRYFFLMALREGKHQHVRSFRQTYRASARPRISPERNNARVLV